MANSGKGLAAIALIFGLLGAGAGGFFVVNEFILTDEEPRYILPMARVYCDQSYDLIEGTTTTIDFTKTSYDTHNAFNLTDDFYLIPETGFYQVYAQVCLDALDEDFYKAYLNVNGTWVASKTYMASRSTNTFTISVYDIVNVTIGEKISFMVYIYNSGGIDKAVFADSAYTFFTISKIP